MDILGPLTKTTEGHKYILLLVDSFSKWPKAFPLRKQESSEIANVLFREIFRRYGAPYTIVSDRGQNFMSKLITAECQIFQVTRHFTSLSPANKCNLRKNEQHPGTMSAYLCQQRSNKLAWNLTWYPHGIPHEPLNPIVRHIPLSNSEWKRNVYPLWHFTNTKGWNESGCQDPCHKPAETSQMVN